MPTDRVTDLLSPTTVREIRLDLTTRCNLRCVYCAVSQSTYRGADMSIGLAQRAVALIGEITAAHCPPKIHINGHGETTFLAGWVDVCKPLFNQKLPLVITTNLAKRLSSEEFEAMARMHMVMVSIDTADPDLMRRLRRKVNLDDIVGNIEGIRTAASRLQMREPSFLISCGLYDKNTLDIENLARFALRHRMKGVGFWNLSSWMFEKFPYGTTDVQPTDQAFPLDELTNDELHPRLNAILRAVDMLERNDVEVHFNGNFITSLRARLEQASSMQHHVRSHDLPPAMTRDCIDPWCYFQLNTNGDVQPCCAHPKVGTLNSEALTQILNGPTIRELRRNLLQGTLDGECANCRLRAPTDPASLQRRILELFKESVERDNPYAAERVQLLLKSAFDDLCLGRSEQAWFNIRNALAIDPGIPDVATDGGDALRAVLPRIIDAARIPVTFTWLAAVFRFLGDNESTIRLLTRYLEIAPDAPDGLHVRRHIEFAQSERVESLMKAAADDIREGRSTHGWSNVWKALAIDPGIHDVEENGTAIRSVVPRVIDGGRFPLTFTWLAAIFRLIGDQESTVQLLRKYLEIAPDASDREHVMRDIRAACSSLQRHHR